MSHLEDLLCEYYQWQGYTVCRNVKVGRLKHGGWEGELDIVAYHPGTRELLHLEPSIDGHSWSKREERFKRKFEAGRKYLKDVFPWIDRSVVPNQIAVLVSSGGGTRTQLAGGKLRTIDEIVNEICEKVREEGLMCSRAIPEQYRLLRTIQLVQCGYYRLPVSDRSSPSLARSFEKS